MSLSSKTKIQKEFAFIKPISMVVTKDMTKNPRATNKDKHNREIATNGESIPCQRIGISIAKRFVGIRRTPRRILKIRKGGTKQQHGN